MPTLWKAQRRPRTCQISEEGLTAAGVHVACRGCSDRASKAAVRTKGTIRGVVFAHDAWQEATFTETQEKSNGQETTVTLHETTQGSDCPPKCYEEREPSAGLELFENPVRRWGGFEGREPKRRNRGTYVAPRECRRHRRLQRRKWTFQLRTLE